jgi:hypothetical protein
MGPQATVSCPKMPKMLLNNLFLKEIKYFFWVSKSEI